MRVLKQQNWFRWIPWAIALALFIMPFFWFGPGEGDFGGDSSRLYFYDPLRFMIHSLDRTIATLNMSAVFWVPLTGILALLQRVVGAHSSVVLPLFDGMLFAGAFLAAYALLGEFIGESSWRRYVAAMLGGLCYITSGLVTYNSYRFPSAYHSIAVYPFMLWLVVRYIRTEQVRYLVFGALVSLVFSTNFAFDAMPVAAAFTLFSGLFIVFYACSVHKVRVAIKGCAILAVLVLGVQAYHLVPQMMILLNTESATNALIFADSGAVDRGLKYFQGNRPWVRLVYNMLAFPQYSLYVNVGAPPAMVAAIYAFGVKYIIYFFAIPITIALGVYFHVTDLDRKRRFTFLSLFAVLAAILYFMTANVFGSWGPRIYEKMFSIPGFSMFRSFYGVFALVLALFLALVFGLSAYYLLVRLRYRIAGAIAATALAAIMVYGAVPFIRGTIANLVQDQTNGVRVSHKIPISFDVMLDYVRRDPMEASIVAVPFTNTDHQVIAGERGGAYIGLPPFQFLAGRSTYAGLATFDYPHGSPFTHEFFVDRVKAGDFRTIERWFSLMNVGYIFLNSDQETYPGLFTGWPFSKDLFALFPSVLEVKSFVKSIGYTPVFTSGVFTLNTNQKYFLPRIYVPRSIIHVPDKEAMQQELQNRKEYDIRSVFLVGQNTSQSLPDRISDAPTIEFSRTNSNRYRIRAHGVRTSFPLVLSVPYQRDWTLYAVPSSRDVSNPETSSAAPVQGVVQNNNLPRVRLRDAARANAIAENTHLVANNFSNFWWIPVGEAASVPFADEARNEDGSYEFEFVLMYTPERHLYWGAGISLLTVCGVGIYGGLSWWLRRKKKIPHII